MLTPDESALRRSTSLLAGVGFVPFGRSRSSVGVLPSNFANFGQR